VDDNVLKEVEHKFNEFLKELKPVFEQKFIEEKENLEKYQNFKIETQVEDLYEDWMEGVETLPLPEIEKVETIPHHDGHHLKIIYCLKTNEATLIRKIKIKSDGEVTVLNSIFFDYKYNDIMLSVESYFDIYGNLIFKIKKGE